VSLLIDPPIPWLSSEVLIFPWHPDPQLNSQRVWWWASRRRSFSCLSLYRWWNCYR